MSNYRSCEHYLYLLVAFTLVGCGEKWNYESFSSLSKDLLGVYVNYTYNSESISLNLERLVYTNYMKIEKNAK